MNLIRIALLLLAPYTLFAFEVIDDKMTTQVLSPAFKEQKTLKLKLSNELSVYLISDPRAEKSAAAIQVNVGSWSEPSEYPGLAHFLEHMLFLGTKQHPEESSYDRYIKQHGGQSNAFTEELYTTFVFDIDTSGFPEALERFSEFFKDPLFNPSGIVRERQAVDQEFSGQLENDQSRQLMIYRELGNPLHPWKRFTWGNKKTLQNVTTDILRNWYDSHYSANLMTLVLYSPLPLDELKELTLKNFENIPNKNLSSFSTTEPLFQNELGGQVIYSEPINERRTLTVFWELPPSFSQENMARPDDLVCYVLGHEGKESLLQQLKKEGLVESISCGSYRWSKKHIIFATEFDLTEEGLKQPFLVLERLFQTIALLKKEPYPRYLFDDIQRMETIKHQFPARLDAFKLVVKNLQGLRGEELATFPEKTDIVQEYNPDLVRALLDLLTPEHALINIMAKAKATGIKSDRQEEWMGTKYSLKAVPGDMLTKWREAQPLAEIQLPPDNPFIPHQLQLVDASEEKGPMLIEDNHMGKLYVVRETSLQTPEASYILTIHTPAVDLTDPCKLVMNEIYIRTLKENLNPYSYLALMAGLDFSIAQEGNSILIKVWGYSEKAETLLKEILASLRKVDPTPEQFNLHKNALKREYQNFNNDGPYSRGLEVFKEVVVFGFAPYQAKEKALQNINLPQLKQHIGNLYNKTYLQGLISGNVTEEVGRSIWKEANELVLGEEYPEGSKQVKKIAVLDKGPFFLDKQIKAKGNGLILAIQDPTPSFETYAAQEIASSLISEPFFNELRTKQQTGYVLGNIQQESERQLFIVFVIESYSHDSRDLLARTELLVEQFVKNLHSETRFQNQFETTKSALANELKKPAQSVKERGEKLYSFAFKYDGDFDWDKKRIAALETITWDRFLPLANNLLGKINDRRLAILIYGNTDSILEYSKAKSVRWLQEKYPYETSDTIKMR